MKIRTPAVKMDFRFDFIKEVLKSLSKRIEAKTTSNNDDVYFLNGSFL